MSVQPNPNNDFANEAPESHQGSHPSLQSIVQKRLRGQSGDEGLMFRGSTDQSAYTEPAENEEVQASATFNQMSLTGEDAPDKESPYRPSPLIKTLRGGRLNAIDTQSPYGIEHYLPTPAIRLQVVQSRLKEELNVLEQDIHHYESLGSQELAMKHKLWQLRLKAMDLLNHKTRVDTQLEEINRQQWQVGQRYGWLGYLGLIKPFIRIRLGQFKESFLNLREALAQWIPLRHWLTLLLKRFNPRRAQLGEMNKQLANLKAVLELSAQHPTTSAQEISAVIHEYEKLLKKKVD